MVEFVKVHPAIYKVSPREHWKKKSWDVYQTISDGVSGNEDNDYLFLEK